MAWLSYDRGWEKQEAKKKAKSQAKRDARVAGSEEGSRWRKIFSRRQRSMPENASLRFSQVVGVRKEAATSEESDVGPMQASPTDSEAAGIDLSKLELKASNEGSQLSDSASATTGVSYSEDDSNLGHTGLVVPERPVDQQDLDSSLLTATSATNASADGNKGSGSSVTQASDGTTTSTRTYQSQIPPFHRRPPGNGGPVMRSGPNIMVPVRKAFGVKPHGRRW
jgi:hypothetical protein